MTLNRARIKKIESRVGTMPDASDMWSFEELAAYRDDAYGFAVEVLGLEPWESCVEGEDGQADVLRAVTQHRLTAVVGSIGTGKSILASIILLWFLATRDSATVVVVGPKAQQTGIVLSNCRQLFYGCPRRLPGEVFETSVRLSESRRAYVVVGASADTMLGHHSPIHGTDNTGGICVIVEEGGGVAERVWQSALSLCVHEADMLVAIGNASAPDQTKTWPAIFLGETSSFHRMRLQATSHPNVFYENPDLIPGGITTTGIDAIRNQWGENSPWFQSRVLARFVANIADALSDHTHLEAAAKRFEDIKLCEAQFLPLADLDLEQFEGYEDRVVTLGVDIATASGGDQTVVCEKRGKVITEWYSWRGVGTEDQAHRIIAILQALGFHKNSSGYDVQIDANAAGPGVLDAMKRLGWRATPYFSQHRADPIPGLSGSFRNKRASLAMWLARHLETGSIAIKRNQRFIEEMSSITYGVNETTGKVQVEGKDSIKARLGRSCDHFDAALMACSDVGSTCSIGGAPVDVYF